jgi:hypothetical protein
MFFKVPVWIVFNLSGSNLYLHGRPEVLKNLQGKNLFLIYNHIYDTDWLIKFVLLEHYGLLGSIKIFLKDSLKYVVSVGFMLYLSEQIFLKRNYDKDEKIIQKAMKSFAENPENYSIAIAPEGKRFHSASLFKEAVEFAKKRNIEPFKYHLIPRVKGFKSSASIIKENPSRFLVLNMEIVYETRADGVVPNYMNLIRGNSTNAHVYLDVIPMEKFEATEECLFEIYREKDRLHENFLKNGKFDDDQSIVKMKIPKNLYGFLSTMFWVFLATFITFNLYFWLITSGKTSLLIATTFMIFILRKLISKLSKISNDFYFLLFSPCGSDGIRNISWKK